MHTYHARSGAVHHARVTTPSCSGAPPPPPLIMDPTPHPTHTHQVEIGVVQVLVAQTVLLQLLADGCLVGGRAALDQGLEQPRESTLCG